MQTGRRLLKLPDVQCKIGQRKSWIYAQIREGRFPAPVPTGPGSVAWLEDELDKWIMDRVADRDQPSSLRGPAKQRGADY